MSTASTWKPKIARLWAKSQTAAEWRLPFALFACGLLAYAAAFAWHMLATFDLVNIIRDANGDDSFYYFQIAYNLAQGKFSTFDGGITQTNGYHPVWMLLITPFYWIFDKETALFGIKAFEIMLVAGGIALIAVAAWLSRMAWLLLFAALPPLYIDPLELLLGLEAAAAMFTLSLLTLAVCLYMRDPQRWKWPLAALAFALPWVRLEYIAISLAVTAVICAIEWSRQERRSLRLSAFANLWHAYIPLIGAAAGILVYFAYNRLVFGTALPVNALTKRAWSQDKWELEGGYDFMQSFWKTLQIGVFDYKLLFALEICAYLLIVWRLALRSNSRRDWLLVAFLVGIFGLAAGHLAKFAQSVLMAHPGDSKVWYFVPAYLIAALIVPVRLYIAIYLIRRFIAPRWRIAANALSVGALVIGAVVLLVRADFAGPFRWVDLASREIYREFEIVSYMGVQVVNQTLPEGSVIGSWDAGVIGYFSRFPVVNMDGLVNSYDYFHASHIAQTVEAEGMNFYRRYGITHFANTVFDQNLSDNIVFEGAPVDSPHGDDYQFKIWTYVSPPDTSGEINYSHWIWDNLKPHFDYLSDDVGLLLNGRMAQAFVKDCALDETLAWTWQERRHDRSVRLAINPYRSGANMCVDARVLPRSAGQPVQADHAKMTNVNDYFANLIASSEPILRSNFDVHIIDRSLIYTKDQCVEEEVAATFFANIYPVEADDLPPSFRQRGYYTIDLDFGIYGTIADDGRCWAELELPNYPIAEIHLGQYAVEEGEHVYIWEEIYSGEGVLHDVGVKADFGMLASRKPIIRSEFDVYMIDDSLIYAKSQCDEEDVTARFFVSIFPLYKDDMPSAIRQGAYESIELDFYRYGAITDDRKCWATLDLPNYPIARIHTGQYVSIDDGYHYPWEGGYHLE